MQNPQFVCFSKFIYKLRQLYENLSLKIEGRGATVAVSAEVTAAAKIMYLKEVMRATMTSKAAAEVMVDLREVLKATLEWTTAKERPKSRI